MQHKIEETNVYKSKQNLHTAVQQETKYASSSSADQMKRIIMQSAKISLTTQNTHPTLRRRKLFEEYIKIFVFAWI